MKKLLICFLTCFFFVFGVVRADDSGINICSPSMPNPFMGMYENQFGFGLGQGFDQGLLIPAPIDPVPFYILSVQYSQPTTFFRVPARRSINISQTIGFGESRGWQWDRYSIPMIYVTEDIALFRVHRFYGGIGAGVGLQAKQNDRLGAKLLFQLKISFGYNLNREWAIEAFIQHFSNANTAEQNHSYAFYGLGATYNF